MLDQETTTNDFLTHVNVAGSPLTLNDFNELVLGSAGIRLPLAAALREKLAASADVVNAAVSSGEVVYGVTTGFGGMSNARVDCSAASELQSNLLTFLAASAGEEIDACHTRGAMLLRANVLLQGKSGIRIEVVEQLLKFFQSDACPVVRELGSIGASGDLLPLSTIARAVTGQSGRVKVRVGDDVLDSTTALDKIGLAPIELQAKEALALVNGTSFSCAIAANAAVAATQSLSLSFVIQSLLMTAMKVNVGPFHRFVHQSKPHLGQIWSAETIDRLLRDTEPSNEPNEMVQDRYSLRCFPQYSGSIVEGIARVRQVIETEMNSVSDNPLIDPTNGQFHQSGNFLGQYIGIAMDDLRRFVGLLSKHIDVQIASIVAPEFNRGLNPSLRGNNERSFNMGLKGLQICGNSIMPMLTWSANPIVEHFPTHAEQFNQNINGLSWGAANLAWKSVGMLQQYLAVASLFAIQAVDLRANVSLGHFDGRELLGDTGRDFYNTVCELLLIEPTKDRPYLFDDTDRWLEEDIETLAGDIKQQGSLVQAVDSVSNSFEDFCEGSA